ncbi:MAG: HAD-IB family hydrolase [Candidatus Acidiferrales bacterium]
MNAPKKIGAFFDLDGTLLRPPSLEYRFIAYLLARDEIRVASVRRWLGYCAKTLLRDPGGATLANKRYLAGIHESVVREWADEVVSSGLPLFGKGIGRVRWHIERGHQVFVISGTLAPLARAIAPYLPGCAEVCGTEVEIVDSYFTGRLVGAHMSFDVKARIVRKLAATHAFDLTQSFAYGNEISDAKMLEAVGHPAAVNPSWKFARTARKRGWIVYKWTQSHAAQREAGNALLAAKVAR